MNYYGFFISLLFPFLSCAQSDFKYNTSTPYQTIGIYQKMYTQSKDNLISAKKQGYTIIFQAFNLINFSSSKAFEYEFPRGTILEKLTMFGDKCYLFYRVWDQPNKIEQLFYREINTTTGECKTSDKLLFEVDTKVTYPPKYISKKVSAGISKFSFGNDVNIGFESKYDYIFSNDKSKLLIQYRKLPVLKKDDFNQDLIGMHVFDEDLNIKWSKEVLMPYTEKRMDNLDYSIDNQGNAYILAKVYKDNFVQDKKIEENIANYDIAIVKINNEQLETSFPKFELPEGKFISKLSLHEIGEGELACIGYYNNGYKSYLEKFVLAGTTTDYKVSYHKWANHVDGICFFKMNKESVVFNQKYFEIPIELLNQYEKNKTKNINNKKEDNDYAQFENLGLDQITIYPDGSLLLIGEQHYIEGYDKSSFITRFDFSQKTAFSSSTSIASLSSYSSQESLSEIFGDILIAKISSKGDLMWMKKLPKHQSGSTRTLSLAPPHGGLSFTYNYNKITEEHYFMFLDNIKNIDLDINTHPSKHVEGASGYFTAYVVDGLEGNVTKKSIFNLTDVQGYKLSQFYTHRVTPLDKGQMIIEAYKSNKEDVLIKVTPK